MSYALAIQHLAGSRGSLTRGGAGARQSGPSVAVGNWLYHTVGEREEAIKTMETEFAQLATDVASQLGWTQDHPTVDTSDPRYTWYHSMLVPVLDEWQKWKSGELGSWWSRWATSWDTIESWKNRLIAIRKAAEDAGFRMNSPAITPLPTTKLEDAGAAAGSLFHWIKIVVLAALGIGAGVLIIQLWRGHL